MKRFILICLLLVSSITSTIFADQLAYNSRETCEKALVKLIPGSTLISYCSLADKEYVDVWQVQNAVVAYTGYEDYYEVVVIYKKLFQSYSPIDEGQYKEPLEYTKVMSKNGDESDLYGSGGIDLAYVYIPNQNGSFICLGRSMGLECRVNVEKINLPQEIVESI
jgi:hypothetical protein